MVDSKRTKTKTKKVASKKQAQMKVKVKGKPGKRSAGHIFLDICLIIMPLIVGVISSAITGNAMMAFGALNQPPLAPPAWLFPIAWTILYILMGVALLLIYRFAPKNKIERRLKKVELVVFFMQLFFNFMWTILFFALGLRWVAFGWLIVMWLMILALIWMCAKNRKAAAWCLVPYLLWCTFAAYLNVMIAILN